jgi:hypothetical protein
MENLNSTENENSSPALDINETLKLVLVELRDSKADLKSLKDEVRGNSASVVSEVKKLKTDTDLKWRSEGHKIQFTLNSEIEDVLKQAPWEREKQLCP